MSFRIQEIIHKFEVGSGYRLLGYVVALIAFFAAAVFYDSVLYRNLTTAEGMDAAQLARNIAQGDGYHTSFIRPLSIFLLERQRQRTVDTSQAANTGTNASPVSIADRLKGNHPDLANPPAYPYLLALALKAMPFSYKIDSAQVRFEVYRPDLWIAGFNQLLFLIAVILVFGIASALFDRLVAWLSAAVMAGTELFWQFTTSGLSTILLIVFFLAVVGALVRVEKICRDITSPSSAKAFWWAALAGLLLGLGALTRYSFGLLVIPALFLLGSGSGRNRVLIAATTAVIFAVVFVPWLARNYALTGTAFGTAGFAVFQDTPVFSGNDLERTLRPEFGMLDSRDLSRKFLRNTGEILLHGIPRLGGSWVAALFLASLLVPFRNVVLGRVRWFLVASLGIFVLAQALGQTAGDDTLKQVSANNLLVIVAPAIFAYGIALLYNLLEQFAIPATRAAIVSVFYLLVSAPLILSFLGPSPSTIVYPPYYPPWIQDKAEHVSPDGWMTSDIPWAVAWYADRQSVWLPLKYGSLTNNAESFYALHERKPLQALYLTPETLGKIDASTILKWRQTPVEDREWDDFQGLIKTVGEALLTSNASQQSLEALKAAYRLSQNHWVKGGGTDWRSFVLGILINGEVPTGFPLQSAPWQQLGDEIFLTESERPEGKSIKGSERIENP